MGIAATKDNRSRRVLAYRGSFRHSSLIFLLGALICGGVPIAVYFGEAQARIGSLLLGLCLLVPFFAASVWMLGKRKALILYPDQQRFLFLDGRFHHWHGLEFGYDEVAKVSFEFLGGALSECFAGATVTLRDRTKLLLDGVRVDEALRIVHRLADEWSVPRVNV